VVTSLNNRRRPPSGPRYLPKTRVRRSVYRVDLRSAWAAQVARFQGFEPERVPMQGGLSPSLVNSSHQHRSGGCRSGAYGFVLRAAIGPHLWRRMEPLLDAHSSATHTKRRLISHEYRCHQQRHAVRVRQWPTYRSAEELGPKGRDRV